MLGGTFHLCRRAGGRSGPAVVHSWVKSLWMTRHPEAAKPCATFMLPNWGVLRGLDKAHEQGFRRFLGAIRHDKRNPEHRRRASSALVTLKDGLAGNGLLPDYDDPYVAAAYVVSYHLSHCIMAYWAFGHLLDRVGVPNALYVCDVGAGTGAARVGLALALLQREECPSTVHFDASEPSDMMRKAGECFWEALPPEARSRCVVPRCGYREDADLPEQLPPEIRGRDDALRVVTAFHLSLPYDNQPWGNVGKDAKSNIQSVLDWVSPHVGVFTAHGGKAASLKQAVGGFARWADSSSARWFDIPHDCGAVSRPSRFYTSVRGRPRL